MSCRVQTKDHNSSYKTDSTIIETRDSVLADIMHGAVAHAFSCTPTNAQCMSVTVRLHDTLCHLNIFLIYWVIAYEGR